MYGREVDVLWSTGGEPFAVPVSPTDSCLRTTDPFTSAAQTHSVNKVGCRVTIAHSYHDADFWQSFHTLLSSKEPPSAP